MTIINISHNIRDVQRQLSSIAREQIPFATAVAITRTARLVERSLGDELRSNLDNPSPYITRGTFSTAAKKQDPNAIVGVRDQASRGASPAHYVQEHFTGGARGLKPFEVALQSIGALPLGMRAVPAEGMRRDRLGNPAARDVTELVGALRRGISVFKKKGKSTVVASWFVRLPGDTRRRAMHIEPGIWRRVGPAGRDGLVPVFLFVEEARYSKRFDLRTIATKVVDRAFENEMAKALDQALRTAR